MSSSRALRAVVSITYALAAVAIAVGLWYAAIAIFDLQAFVMPTPWASISSVWDNRDALAPLLVTTVKETVYGFLIGAGLGFVAAIVMAQSRMVQRLLYPALVTSQAVPIVAIAPPLVILFGFGFTPKLIIIALIVFFPVMVSVLDGLASIDRDLLNLARIMNGGRLRTFALIKLPAAFGPMFSGLKIGATYAVTGAVIGEWTASSGAGLGSYIQSADASLDTAGVYGATILLTAIGVSSFLLVVGLERLCTPWLHRSQARRRRRRPPSPPPGVGAGAPVASASESSPAHPLIAANKGN